jgi:hypothetical protein
MSLGENQRRKITCFRWTPSKRFSAAFLRKRTQSGRSSYPASRAPRHLAPPTSRLKRAEVDNLSPKNFSGYVLIAREILKELSVIGIKYLTQLFNAV